MKTLLQPGVLFTAGLLISLSFLSSCQAEQKEASKTATQIAMSVPEDVIDMYLHIVEPPDGLRQLQAAVDSIFIGCTDTIPVLVDKIDSTHFRMLKDSAIKIDPAYEGRRIYALRFIYGLGEDKRMQLIYQPLLLKRDCNDTIKVNAEYTPDSCVSYFKYTTKGFEVVSPSYMQTVVDRYQRNITFLNGKKKGEKLCRPFNFAMDTTGDVRRIVFSFQEIDSLLIGHNATELYVLSSAKILNIGGKNYTKHLMLLGSENFHVKGFSQGIFYNKFGNLSHLCPPSCDRHAFNLK